MPVKIHYSLSNKPNGHVRLGIDKLTLTGTPGDNWYSPDAEKFLLSGMSDKTLPLAKSFAASRYRVSARIEIDGIPKKAFPLLEVGPRGKDAACRLEFNPNTLGSNGIKRLKELTSVLHVGDWSPGWTSARITRVDVNLDFSSLSLENVLAVSRYKRVREIWMHNGKLQIIYLGRKEQSASVFCMYMHDNRLRVEHRDRRPKPKILSQLANYKNPFGKIAVMSADVSPPVGFNEAKWRMALDLMQARGPRSLESRLTFVERKKLGDAISHAIVHQVDAGSAWPEVWRACVTGYGFA